MLVRFSARQFHALANDRKLFPFRSHFGTSPRICAYLWKSMTLPNGALPEHLLWALLFMKVYATEAVLANMLGVCRNTFRKWIWLVLGAMHALEGKVVSFRFFQFFLINLFLTQLLSFF